MKRISRFLAGGGLTAGVVRAGSAALLILLAAASSAPAQGDAFYQRMLRWEAETGKKSRMTHYARIETLGLPLPDEAAQQAMEEFIDMPVNLDSPVIGGLIAAYMPALEILTQAWGVPGVETFQPTRDDAPMPDLRRLRAVARVGICRARAYRMRGDGEAGLADLANVWLLGYTLEASQYNTRVTDPAFQLRRSALRWIQDHAARESLFDEDVEKLLAIFSTHPPVRTNFLLQNEIEMGRLPELVKEAAPSQYHACIDEGVARMRASLRDAAAAPAEGRRAAMAAFDQVMKDVASGCPPFSGGFPGLHEVTVAQFATNADESAFVTCLVVALANRRNGGNATDEQIAATAAGPLAPFLIDPFTDKPLVIFNGGWDMVTVHSTGPDLVIDPTRSSFVDPSEGWDSGGDIFFTFKE